MGNQAVIDFMVKFSELNEVNQKYIMAIQQALAFAQTSSASSEETGKEKSQNVKMV